MKRIRTTILVLAVSLIGSYQDLFACTNLLVTPGASADGSTYITYAVDSHEFYGELIPTPARIHREGAMREVWEWDTGEFLGRIPQPRETYSVIGHMNEHQVAIGETTFGGREELRSDKGLIDCQQINRLMLERCTTAREAIALAVKERAKAAFKTFQAKSERFLEAGLDVDLVDASLALPHVEAAPGEGLEGLVHLAAEKLDPGQAGHGLGIVRFDPSEMSSVLIFRDKRRLCRALPQQANAVPEPHPEPQVPPPSFCPPKITTRCRARSKVMVA